MTGKLIIDNDYITKFIAPSRTVFNDCFGWRIFYGIKSVFNRTRSTMLDYSVKGLSKKLVWGRRWRCFALYVLNSFAMDIMKYAIDDR